MLTQIMQVKPKGFTCMKYFNAKLDKQDYSATGTLALTVVISVGFTHLWASAMSKHLFCTALWTSVGIYI